MRRRCQDDRGATALLIAFSMVGLLAFGGLVIDGGNGYAQRRQMQNAADSAATAGTNALYLHKTEAAPAANIYGDALEQAEDNGADTSTFECDLVLFDSAGLEVGTAACQGASTADLAAAWKVRVNVDSVHRTRLMSVVGVDSFTARATAAASLFAAAPSRATAPFAVCASPSLAGLDPDPGFRPLLLEDDSDPTGFVINDAAIGRTYNIWGNDIRDAGRNCGGGNSFRGLVGQGEFDLPGWWSVKTGNSAGNEASPLIGGCTATQIHDVPVGCEFAIPLCVAGNGQSGNNFELFCVKFGRFRVTQNSNGQPNMDAEFLGRGLFPAGEGAGIPSLGDVMVIKLSE